MKDERLKYLDCIKANSVFILKRGFCDSFILEMPRVKVRIEEDNKRFIGETPTDYYYDILICYNAINKNNNEKYYDSLKNFMEMFDYEEYTILDYVKAREYEKKDRQNI